MTDPTVAVPPNPGRPIAGRTVVTGPPMAGHRASEDVAVAPPPAADSGEDLLDDEWERPRRTNRLTWILLAAIVAALAFAGGVAVQKAHDTALVGSVTTRARAAGGFGGGTGTGGQGRNGAAGTGQGSGAGQGGGTGAGTGGDAGGAGSAGAGTPVAVGTIKTVSGQTLTLTDFGGTVVTVHIPATATVTTVGLNPPAVGSPVSVMGTKAPDGSVTAVAITVRAAAG